MFLELPGSDKVLMIKNPLVSGGDAKEVIEEGLIPGSGRSPRVGSGNPLQYSVPGKFHGQRSVTVHGATKSHT